MIETIEIAPYIFASTLVDVVDAELWESIMAVAWEDSGLSIEIDREKLRQAFIQAMLKGGAGTVR